jgi:hypothetical protein
MEISVDVRKSLLYAIQFRDAKQLLPRSGRIGVKGAHNDVDYLLQFRILSIAKIEYVICIQIVCP